MLDSDRIKRTLALGSARCPRPVPVVAIFIDRSNLQEKNPRGCWTIRIAILGAENRLQTSTSRRGLAERTRAIYPDALEGGFHGDGTSALAAPAGDRCGTSGLRARGRSRPPGYDRCPRGNSPNDRAFPRVQARSLWRLYCGHARHSGDPQSMANGDLTLRCVGHGIRGLPASFGIFDRSSSMRSSPGLPIESP